MLQSQQNPAKKAKLSSLLVQGYTQCPVSVYTVSVQQGMLNDAL